MAELIDKWEVVSKLITLQNNYTFFKNEWDAERLYREITKLEIGIGKTPGMQVVRCKDCKHYHARGNRGNSSNWDCKKVLCCRSANVSTKPDDFCSYGERREGE